MVRTALWTFVAVVVVAYPVLVFYGLQRYEPRFVALAAIAVFALRLVVVQHNRQSAASGQTLLVTGSTLAVLLLLALAAGFNSQVYLKMHPIVVNLIFGTVFVHSLLYGPPVIERLARLRHSDLPAHAVHHTRRATIAWSIFFVLNACISAYTALATSIKVWTLYNGLIAYILMGVMFAGEWIVRQFVQRQAGNQGSSV